MDELLDAIAVLVTMVSAEKMQAIAGRVRRVEVSKAATALPNMVGTPVASTVVEQLAAAWQGTKVGSDELASMLIAASHVYAKATSEKFTELVWTGPTTPFVPVRRTEQALLQVINSAEQSLFIVSFVVYNVSTLVHALNMANGRGVAISMLLELSEAHGGSITFDTIGKMRTLVPTAKLYSWDDKVDPFADGCVHAKAAVADGKMCFITSANLTGHAMEKNMEAGVLISRGDTPTLLDRHLTALVDTKVVSPI